MIKQNAKYLKIIHFNAQGLLEGTHFENICSMLVKLDVDVIAISESWLNSNISNKMIDINRYQLFRSDRKFKRGLIKKEGGGVCMYVNRLV